MKKSQIFKKLFFLLTFILTISVLSLPVNASIETQIENTPTTTLTYTAFINIIDPIWPLDQINSADFASLDRQTPPKISVVATATPKILPIAPTSSIASVPGKPAQLSIPAINVNARIEHIGLTPEGAVGVPEGAFDVSWFSAGTLPGQKGSAVISGHSGIWKDGTRSIFDPLPTLKIGETIYVKNNKGQTLSFIVKETRIYGKDATAPEIFNKSDKAYLNIITCYGTWLPKEKTYDKRYVVFAELQ